MKHIFFILLISLFFTAGCSTSQNAKELKIKTFKKDGYSFNYFNSWSPNYYARLDILTRKSFVANGINIEANNLSITKKEITPEFKTVEEIIMNDVAITKGHAKNVTFVIKKKNKGLLYELELYYEFNGIPYRKLGHYRKKNDIVYALVCTFEQDIYKAYLNDVMLAFNSFKFID